MTCPKHPDKSSCPSLAPTPKPSKHQNDTGIEITFSIIKPSKPKENDRTCLMYEEDEDYNEPYMSELLDETSTGVQTDLTLGDKLESESLNSIVQSPTEAQEEEKDDDSTFKLPWENINLLPPGTYSIAKEEKAELEELSVSETESESESIKGIGDSESIKGIGDSESTIDKSVISSESGSDSDSEEEVAEISIKVQKSVSISMKIEKSVITFKEPLVASEESLEMEKEEKEDGGEEQDGGEGQDGDEEEEDGGGGKDGEGGEAQEIPVEVPVAVAEEIVEEPVEVVAQTQEIEEPQPQKGVLILTESEQKILEEQQNSKKFEFVFEGKDFKRNEPYMDSLRRAFTDVAEIDTCDSRTEMPWKDIVLPKNCKIKKVEKIRECPCRDRSAHSIASSEIIDIHRGFQEAKSTVMPVARSTATFGSSVYSDVHQMPKRSDKLYTINLDLAADGAYSVSFQSGSEKPQKVGTGGEAFSSASFPFTISARQDIQEEASSVIINIKQLSAPSKEGVRPYDSNYRTRTSASMPQVTNPNDINAVVSFKQLGEKSSSCMQRVRIAPDETSKTIKVPGENINININLLGSTIPSETENGASDANEIDEASTPNEVRTPAKTQSIHFNLPPEESPPIELPPLPQLDYIPTIPSVIANYQIPPLMFDGTEFVMSRKKEKPVFKEDPVASALKTYEEEMQPLKDALQQLREQLKSIDMPEIKAFLRPPKDAFGLGTRSKTPNPAITIRSRIEIRGSSRGSSKATIHIQPKGCNSSTYPSSITLPSPKSNKNKKCRCMSQYSQTPRDPKNQNSQPQPTEAPSEVSYLTKISKMQMQRVILSPHPFRMEQHPQQTRDLVMQARNYSMYPDYRGRTYPDERVAYTDSTENEPSYNIRKNQRSPFAECDRSDSSTQKSTRGVKPKRKLRKGRKSKKSSQSSLDIEESCIACKLRPGQALKTNPEDFLPPVKSKSSKSSGGAPSVSKITIKIPRK